jgi:hypothetical protein
MSSDPWHFPRTVLAEQVLGMFDTGLASALTFFAPRRMGKTEFLRKDITPAAEARGWRVFYFSFLDADSSAAQSFALALTAFAQGNGWLPRMGKALGRIGKVSGSVGGVEAGLELRGTEAEDIKAVIQRLAGGPSRVLLLLDEVQALASPAHRTFVAALRTALDLNKERVSVIFTGSSREGLRRMFSQASAPFFHFGQNLPFPQLDRAFTDHLAVVFNHATRRAIDPESLWQAFIDMGRVPQLARSLVERIALNPALSVEQARDGLVQEINHGRNYASDWERCSALDQMLLAMIATFAEHLEPYSVATREVLAKHLGVPEVAVSAVQSSLRGLTRRSLVFKPEGRSNYEIEDPMFREWLLTEKLPPPTAAPPG